MNEIRDEIVRVSNNEQHVRMCVCMYNVIVFINISIDAWMHGCIYGCMDVYMYACVYGMFDRSTHV